MPRTVSEPRKIPFRDVFRQYESAMLVFFIYTVSPVYAFDHRFIAQQILFMQYYHNVAWAYYKLRH